MERRFSSCAGRSSASGRGGVAAADGAGGAAAVGARGWTGAGVGSASLWGTSSEGWKCHALKIEVAQGLRQRLWGGAATRSGCGRGWGLGGENADGHGGGGPARPGREAGGGLAPRGTTHRARHQSTGLCCLAPMLNVPVLRYIGGGGTVCAEQETTKRLTLPRNQR